MRSASASWSRPIGAIYCHRLAHIEQDECGAPEFYTNGAKLVPLDGDGTQARRRRSSSGLLALIGGGLSCIMCSLRRSAITQASECGTVYRPDEIAEIGLVAQKHGLGLHMDGARFANALEFLGCAPADITWRAGVDVLVIRGNEKRRDWAPRR